MRGNIIETWAERQARRRRARRGWLLAGCALGVAAACAGAWLGGALAHGELGQAAALTGLATMAYLLAVGCFGKAERRW